VETEPKQEGSDVEQTLSEDKMEMGEIPSRVTKQMKAQAGALFPGLPQGSNGSTTLVMGSFSVFTMPMSGISNVLQNILPLLQKLPDPTQLISGDAADLSK
jgi:hypothetical protein